MSPLVSLCAHSLGGLGPSALIRWDSILVWEGALRRACILDNGS